MIIEEDIKLDFNDVLIKPKRSTLVSRNDVDIKRVFIGDGLTTINAVPIIVANMDTVGTFEMARALKPFNCMVAIHKHYSSDELIDFFGSDDSSLSFYSMGTSPTEQVKMLNIIHNGVDLPLICVDVANGYTESFLKHVKEIRELLPRSFIMAGNVVTPEMTEELILSGVNCVKVGIGPGCFVENTRVTTVDGVKNIQDIKDGDSVLTHNNTFESVISTMSRPAAKSELVTINGITCTKNHEFFVIKLEDKDKVNDENYLDFAVWLSADLLNKTHFLIEL